jgi:hypothetical protein
MQFSCDEPYLFYTIIKKLKNYTDIHFVNNQIVYSSELFSYNVNLNPLITNSIPHNFTVITKNLIRCIISPKQFDNIIFEINDEDIEEGIPTYINVILSNDKARYCNRIKLIESQIVTIPKDNILITNYTIESYFISSFIKPINKKQRLTIEFIEFPSTLMIGTSDDSNEHCISIKVTEDIKSASVDVPIYILTLIPQFIYSDETIDISIYNNYISFGKNDIFNLHYHFDEMSLMTQVQETN